MTVTIGRIPSGVHIVLLIKASCMNMDSSSTATVKSLGIREIISLAFLNCFFSSLETRGFVWTPKIESIKRSLERL
ncbi:MAG: hypothetical protein WBZ36_11580 [Candidatus Nitrosopolaris sp.]